MLVQLFTKLPVPSYLIRFTKALRKTKIALKGPITTPVGSGFRSINVALRKKYDLYSNIRPVKSIEGLNHKFDDINMVIFRENTEGLYSGVEKQISDDEAHAIKIITKKGSERIVKSAFEYAKNKVRHLLQWLTKLTL